MRERKAFVVVSEDKFLRLGKGFNYVRGKYDVLTDNFQAARLFNRRQDAALVCEEGDRIVEVTVTMQEVV